MRFTLRRMKGWEVNWGKPRFGAKSKSLYEGEKKSHLFFCQFAPGGAPYPTAPGGEPHYHLFHEWAYNLECGYITYEFAHPNCTTKRAAGWIGPHTLFM